MSETIFWGAALRVAQAALVAAPTVVVGLFVAGVFARLLGPSGTRRLFGAGTWRELPQAWLIGMLLPVCSLGAIPIARQMRRSGLAGGTILAFAMTAPLFNPLSLLYGLTLSEPSVVLAFALGSMVVVTAVGSLWDRLFPRSGVEHPVASAAPTQGARRMVALATTAGRELAGPSAAYLAVGLLGVGALAASLAPGRLQGSMEHTNPYAPALMAAVATPAYATPMMAMSQLGSMFQHANSPGAAFALLTLGAGANLGLLAWIIRGYGFRRGLAWVAILAAVVLALAYAGEGPLYPRDVDPPGHTHAFDLYSRPFYGHESALPALVATKLRDSAAPHELAGLAALGGLALLGLGLRLFDRRGRLDAWLASTPTPDPVSPTSWRDRAVPVPVLYGVAFAGLAAFSVVGCLAYYPPPDEVFEEMTILRGEVLNAAMTGNYDHAEHFLPIYEDWAGRLQVGAYLREWHVSPYRRMKARVFLDRLERLEHALEARDLDEAKRLVLLITRAQTRLRMAYLSKPG